MRTTVSARRRGEALFFGEDVHGALYALFHHGAGDLIRLLYIAHEVIVVGAASAAAYEFSKAVIATSAGKKTGRSELAADIRVQLSLVHVAHVKIPVARKLVAGIDVAVRRDGKIFVAGAAGGHAL